MRISAQWLFAAAGSLAACPASPALPPLVGDPPHTRLSPDFTVYPRNLDLAQAPDGVIYAANDDGVLTFDGARWRMTPLPGEHFAQALAHDGATRLYVGSYDRFGYLARDAAGLEVFHDLTAHFANELKGEQFAEVLDVHIAPVGVFFVALRHLFLYDPVTGAARLWRHQGRFGALGGGAGRTVLQFHGEGLREYLNGAWQLLPGSAALGESLLHGLVELPEGGLLALAADGRWRVYEGGAVRPYAMPPGFPPSSGVTSAVVLADATLAMSGADGSVFLFDPGGAAYRRLRLESGKLSRIIVARDGGLLTASHGYSHLYRIEWPAAWTELGARQGLAGAMHGMAQWGARWFALTSVGVQELLDRRDGTFAFAPRDWTLGDAWALLPLDQSSALLAGSQALYLVRGDAVRAISHDALYPRELQRSRFNPDVIWVGRKSGLAMLKRVGGEWRVALEQNDLGNLRVISLVETAPGALWISSNLGGVWRLDFGTDYKAVREARRFGEADGLALGESPGARLTLLADGTLFVSGKKGFFRYTGARFEPTDLDGLGRLREPDEWMAAFVAPDGVRWVGSAWRLFRELAGGAARWQQEELGCVNCGANHELRFDAAGNAVLITHHSALAHRPGADADGADGVPPGALLRALDRITRDGARLPQPLDRTKALVLPQGDFSLQFSYALPDFRRPDAVRYATRLTGLEGQFSEWSPIAVANYAHLRAGDYRFELRARDVSGRVTEIEPFRIRVLPPWYFRPVAHAAWLLLGSAALWLLTHWVTRGRTRRLAADKLSLERQVAQRTAELASANRRLDAAAHTDGLTGVANRRRLDGYLGEAWARCATAGEPLALLAIDVDGFKRFNDQHGHLRGDEMLTRMVDGLSRCLTRKTELLARYGGDEFMVVLPGVEPAAARTLAERMRAAVEALQLGATISIGVAGARPAPGGAVASLLGAADAALYQAKTAGRNRVAAAAAPAHGADPE